MAARQNIDLMSIIIKPVSKVWSESESYNYQLKCVNDMWDESWRWVGESSGQEDET